MFSSEQPIAKPNMLIMLDAVLDIPTAIIKRDYPEIGESILNNVNYRNRVSDEMHLIDPRINTLSFSSAYSTRDADILDYAKASLMIPYINKLLTRLQLEIDGNNPVIKDINIVINMYPYQLDEDRAKLISLGLSTALGLTDVCEMAYIPLEEIDKKFLLDNGICHLVLYDFNEWTTKALPDNKGSDLTEMGLDRIENFTVTAAKIALVSEAVNEAKKAFEDYGMLENFDEWTLLPWNLLFELDLLPVVFFTELDDKLKEKIMNDIAESNKAIDIEVSLIAEFQNLLGIALTNSQWMDMIPQRIAEISNDIVTYSKDVNPTNVNRLRLLLAENRFLIDVMSNIIPTQPAIDFERFVDSEMSKFDTSFENSQISEGYWNKRNVKCRRVTREIKGLGRDAFVLLAYEDCIDSEGIIIRKNDVLKSAMFFEPILENVTQTEIDVYSVDMKGEE